jgi:hypothetical protein
LIKPMKTFKMRLVGVVGGLVGAAPVCAVKEYQISNFMSHFSGEPLLTSKASARVSIKAPQ